jgi:hypothetical protein
MEGLAPVAHLGVEGRPCLRIEGLALELAQYRRPLVELRLEFVPMRHQLRVLIRGETVEEGVGTPAGPCPGNLAHLLIGRLELRPELADLGIELLEHRLAVLLTDHAPLLHEGPAQLARQLLGLVQLAADLRFGSEDPEVAGFLQAEPGQRFLGPDFLGGHFRAGAGEDRPQHNDACAADPMWEHGPLLGQAPRCRRDNSGSLSSYDE